MVFFLYLSFLFNTSFYFRVLKKLPEQRRTVEALHILRNSSCSKLSKTGSLLPKRLSFCMYCGCSVMFRCKRAIGAIHFRLLSEFFCKVLLIIIYHINTWAINLFNITNKALLEKNGLKIFVYCSAVILIMTNKYFFVFYCSSSVY